MKLKPVIISTLLAVAPLAGSHAEDSHHPGKGAQGMATSTSQGGGMMMGGMQDHMKKMMQQMEKIRNTQDPDERDKLIEEHMQSMQEGMSMMGGMGAGKQGGKMQSDMPSRMSNMEQRMDMMQMMMDQMMQSRRESNRTQKLHDHRKVHK